MSNFTLHVKKRNVKSSSIISQKFEKTIQLSFIDENNEIDDVNENTTRGYELLVSQNIRVGDYIRYIAQTSLDIDPNSSNIDIPGDSTKFGMIVSIKVDSRRPLTGSKLVLKNYHNIWSINCSDKYIFWKQHCSHIESGDQLLSVLFKDLENSKSLEQK